MSTHQLEWNRSYRQALEMVARQRVDAQYKGPDRIGFQRAEARLQLIADLWQVGSITQVLDDLEYLRETAAEWMRSILGREPEDEQDRLQT